MTRLTGWFSHILTMANNSPWGSGPGGSGGSGDSGSGGDAGGGNGSGGPRNPWQPAGAAPTGGRKASNIEELFKRRGGGGGGFGGGGFGGLPRRPNGKSYLPIAIGLIFVLWLLLTSIHRVGPQERGVVSLLGSYSRTLEPGIALTLPSPLESFQAVDVQNIRTIDIPTAGTQENLILTGDQNLVDLAYSVRWTINDPTLYLFQLADPEATIREAAEAAMRASVAEVTLDDAIGPGRIEVEQKVEQRMKELLDSYRSGIQVQGVAIKKADPPEAVNEAFKAVSAAQQEAQTFLNEARAYAQQLTAAAQGEAAAFDKVYEEYRMAPDVTRRRMYYETMERVLSKLDKTIIEPGNVVPYLPLPELRKRVEATPPPAPAAGEAR
ncbi:FtsH protease activity modulator HflK [Blastomonas sp.]|uniref:FtsH protease activity modulator HflK n=1 Tax=Blastomonas sp. TaxID=1909299 RepID=UPI00262EF2CA|nr:FtsH protease activity modulator HflK [Blastomonas sp.]MDM7957312.1 FtsH protease activity modulator HflK [Blastomonas sp.]